MEWEICWTLLQYRNTAFHKDGLSSARKLYGHPMHAGHYSYLHTIDPLQKMATQRRSCRTASNYCFLCCRVPISIPLSTQHHLTSQQSPTPEQQQTPCWSTRSRYPPRRLVKDPKLIICEFGWT